jgi:hypothetical protein
VVLRNTNKELHSSEHTLCAAASTVCNCKRVLMVHASQMEPGIADRTLPIRARQTPDYASLCV